MLAIAQNCPICLKMRICLRFAILKRLVNFLWPVPLRLCIILAGIGGLLLTTPRVGFNDDRKLALESDYSVGRREP